MDCAVFDTAVYNTEKEKEERKTEQHIWYLTNLRPFDFVLSCQD